MSLIDLSFAEMQLFVSVVRAGSITAAANHMEIPKSTLSRRLKHLEESLGTRLLERTTRHLRLTEAGSNFYPRCEQILQQVEEAHLQVTAAQDLPEGKLCIYSPNELSEYLLTELAAKFAQAHPGLRIEFVSGAGKHRLLEDNIDIMIHIDEPQDSTFIARKITVATTNYYASPDYLTQKGWPQQPEDLHNHDCIVELNHERLPRPWLFPNSHRDGLRVTAKYSCDSIHLCRILAEQGLGVTMIPDFICQQHLHQGRLVKLFGGRYEIAHNLYAIYPSRHYIAAKTRAFLDFLQQYFPAKL